MEFNTFEKEIFIKSLKTRTIFPFYIKDVNEKFFSNLNNHQNKIFLKKILPKIENELEHEELEVIKTIENLAKPEKILRMINLALKKIAALTGTKSSELFEKVGTDEFKEPFFIRIKSGFNDLEILGDKHEDFRFSYAINISRDNYLFPFIEQIQLAFFLDQETNRVSGGFSLNRGNEENNLDYEESVENVYFYSVMKKFWLSQLYPLSLDNILNIIYEINGNKSSKNTKNAKINVSQKNNSKKIAQQGYSKDWAKVIDFEQVSLEELQDNWKKFINKKFLKFNNFSEEKNIFYEEQAFYMMMIMSLVMLYLLQEINTYFTSEKPELILGLLNKPAKLTENKDQNYQEDFNALASYIYKNFYLNSNTSNNLKIKKIDRAKELVDFLSDYSDANTSNIILNNLISSFEVLPIDKIHILDRKDFLENSKFKSFFLLLMFPELYSISPDNATLIEYKQLLNSLKANQNVSLSNSVFKDFDDYIAELNYDYASFITQESIVILKNNDPLYVDVQDKKILVLRDENRRVYNNYYWAVIYLQAKIAEKNNIEFNINRILNSEIKHKSLIFKEAIQNLDDLQFDWYDHFYGLPIKNIVQKMDKGDNLKKSIDILSSKIKKEDQDIKKSTERNYITLAFIIAVLLGFIDFISMVFTILPNSPAPVSDSYIYTFIAIGSFISLILVIIFSVTIIRILLARRKANEFDKRKNF